MSKALEINNLTKQYASGVQALKNINLDIEEGDFFALLGANGAGKTTIIGILTDLVRKTSGQVKIFDKDIDQEFNEAKKLVGVVPQEFNFNRFEKVFDIVAAQAGYYGIRRAEAVARTHEILDKLSLGDKKQETSSNLSGGMKRRLMIARALVHKPKLLLLDEPTAGVDVELRRGMWEYLIDLNKNQGITILLTTHYLEEVEQLCANAAIIKQGEIIKQDSVKNLLHSLEKEVYVVDLLSNIEQLKNHQEELNQHFPVKLIDDSTLEIIVDKNRSINELIKTFDQYGVQVSGIRSKANRLEELFLNLVKA